jgi:DNA-binding NtrC family response regulator
MAERILLVDDDPNILDGFRRSLSREFLMETALGAELALKLVAENGPYAVVVSDMRMPGMDGVQFLSKVKAQSPDTIRVMLTGNADMDTAVHAINEGSIFRFLNKP